MTYLASKAIEFGEKCKIRAITPFKVIEVGTNRKPVYNFPLAIYTRFWRQNPGNLRQFNSDVCLFILCRCWVYPPSFDKKLFHWIVKWTDSDNSLEWQLLSIWTWRLGYRVRQTAPPNSQQLQCSTAECQGCWLNARAHENELNGLGLIRSVLLFLCGLHSSRCLPEIPANLTARGVKRVLTS